MKQALMKNATPVLTPAIKASLKRFYAADKPVTPLEAAERVLVFAPHIDDETIGLGGTLRRYADMGTHVTIAIITDGKNSNASTVDADKLADTRKQELLSIQELLGFTDIRYLDYPDSQIKQVQSSDRIQSLIEDIRPDTVYVTSLIDAHPDHVYSAHLVASALKKSAHQPKIVREYEINCPVPPSYINCIMDITDQFPVKQQATEAFKSQVIAFDGFLALANIKASQTKEKNVRYVETFIENTAPGFIQAAEHLAEGDRQYEQHFKQANRTVTLWWAIFKNLKLKKAIYKSR
ncbi:PIG-L deacetylase family protein [Planococcus sp. ISL-109]|uniref:PIG-L deacetylase family protein n=1 Tax=Planococcus sp. ISL-109 TaxID=2819166 RepID=UPI001BE892C1|nr:PIG-L deacetylase family protein [Planococcus sp. ISL-109]MBT2581289.1 PIG-L family deacetylase [Planococcus sp. ISL-109]